jgi:hypothetical protein
VQIVEGVTASSGGRSSSKVGDDYLQFCAGVKPKRYNVAGGRSSGRGERE